MISRRDTLLSLACLSTAGAGILLKPHRKLSLFREGQALNSIVPASFGVWRSQDVGDLFAPPSEDSLQARLYSDVLGRLYASAKSGGTPLMLMAHGDAQTNALQLHRPEVCYPAFGYTILESRLGSLPITSKAALPVHWLLAQGPEHQEVIVYWTRMGEELPTSGAAQRMARMKAALRGYSPDGLLARFSVQTADVSKGRALLSQLVRDLLAAVKPINRRSLIGTELAARLG